MNGGTCTDMVDAYECTCSAGWAGGHCELEVDPCPRQENDCDKKKAQCYHVGSGVHECRCNPGYETQDGAKTCTNIQECTSSPCMNGSTCMDGACTDAACLFQWSCVCDNGWAGEQCEIDLDECASYPCLSGTTCIDGVFVYQCVCSGGLSGYNCEVDIDECESKPCMNAATCTDSNDNGARITKDIYVCTCVAGFSGDICD